MAAEHQVVFLSLYGEDVPEGVPRYLKSGLERSGIRVLKRDNKGSEDLRTVLNKIRETSFVLVIFSDGFAKSGECLNELVLVKKRMDIGKLRTIPIYYKVEPEQVIHVQGSFGNMLEELGSDEYKTAMGNGMEALLRTEVRLRNWKEALASVTATGDFMYRQEDDFIEKITKQVNKAYAKDDQAIENQFPMSQRTVEERTEALVSLLRRMGLGFEGNFSLESDSIHKYSEQCKEQLSKLISEEGANPIPVFEKSPTARNQVFISFHGPDVPSGLLRHLISALKRYGINLAMGVDIRRESSVSESISQVIKDSGIALVVFSQNYAVTKWCLDELTVIKKYMNKEMLRVIPIFYRVEPRDVKRQIGLYMHGETTDVATILTWQKALLSVLRIMGIVYYERSDRSESELIDAIVVAVKRLLASLPSES